MPATWRSLRTGSAASYDGRDCPNRASARLRVGIAPYLNATINLRADLSMACLAARDTSRRKRRSGYAFRCLVCRCASNPVINEGSKPILRGQIVHRTVGDVLVALLGARQFHSMGAAHEPSVHHGVRDFRVELQRISRAKAKRLNRERIAFGQQLTAGRQLEPLAMPLVDVVGPVGADLAPSVGWADRIVANLGMPLWMREDVRTEMTRHHL